MPLRRRPRALLAAAAVVANSITLAACGAGNSTEPAQDAGWTVVASFYPLQFVAERVGGSLVTVTNLTKPGAEPHDLELAPQDIGAVIDADLALYLSTFQPAVDAAVAQKTDGDVLDVNAAADLSLTYAAEGASSGEVVDPHFWLDPLRLADVADQVADSLSQLDPSAQATFEAGAAELRSDLEELDADFRKGLAHCDRRQLVTSHTAFGYLADRYALEQVGITGLTPEAEPNPQELANLTEFVTTNDVQTIFYETLVSPDVAQTIANTTGANTDVLDPVEGLSDASEGEDYLQVMQSNLANLQAGLPCH